MTNILLIEDGDIKGGEIEEVIWDRFDNKKDELTRVKTRNSAFRKIYGDKFDLIIVDLSVPDFEGELPSDQTENFIDAILDSPLNLDSDVIILSGFPEIVDQNRDRISAAGINVIEYAESDNLWKTALCSTLTRIKHKFQFSFILITALAKERSAYQHTNAEMGDFVSLNGLDCQYIDIDQFKGVCVLLPRMGLVEAATTAARAIETFQPKCVVMSGICGGIKSNADIGTLVVGDPVWEYQTGKWHDDGFSPDMYQETINTKISSPLRTLIASDPCLKSMKEGTTVDEKLINAPAIMAPMATGSAVVADEQRLNKINAQHRKLAAIDMEMFGVYRAAATARTSPLVFGAKVVVDTADSAKGDQYHSHGSALSAKFCVEAIRNLIPQI